MTHSQTNVHNGSLVKQTIGGECERNASQYRIPVANRETVESDGWLWLMTGLAFWSSHKLGCDTKNISQLRIYCQMIKYREKCVEENCP